MQALTTDERFLLKIYQMASALGDPHAPLDRYAVGRAIGHNDKGVNATVRWLAQANFIKHGDTNQIYLTDNGLSLSLQLLEQSS